MTRLQRIEQYQWLVYQLIKEIPHKRTETEDLISTGMIGLIKAADNYEERRGIRFQTYAAKCITNEVRSYYRKLPDEILISDEQDGWQLKRLQEERQKMEELTALRLAVQTLREEERMIVDLHFGLSGTKVTQQVIAEFFGVSQSRISREEKRIIRRLREEMENS